MDDGAVRPSGLRSLLGRRSVWAVAALVLAVALAFGLRALFGKAKVRYVTVAVERGDLESTVVAAGILQPIKYVDVGAQVSGKLKLLKVVRGDHVALDELLGEIAPELLATALSSAKAALASMTSLRALKEATLGLALAQRDRNEALADVAALTAQMKEASAAVATATSNLGFTRITAPMAGEIVSISLLEGQTLNANQSAPNILRIADLSTVTVWAQVSEADISRVKVGQAVYFTVLGQTRRWDGRIRQILPTPELISNVVFYDVLFDIANADQGLKIQMTAQVFIVLAQAKGVLLLPASAVGNAAEGSQVMVQVLEDNGSLQPRLVTLDIKSELCAEVRAGLAEHERVVTGGGPRAKAAASSPLSTRKGP